MYLHIYQTTTLCELQHTATHSTAYIYICIRRRLSATPCNTLQHTATHCNTLQHTLQHTSLHICTYISDDDALRHCNTLLRTTLTCMYMHARLRDAEQHIFVQQTARRVSEILMCCTSWQIECIFSHRTHISDDGKQAQPRVAVSALVVCVNKSKVNTTYYST